jgi:hypothetical protein
MDADENLDTFEDKNGGNADDCPVGIRFCGGGDGPNDGGRGRSCAAAADTTSLQRIELYILYLYV